MKQRLADLAYRRQALLERIQDQRMEVAEIAQHWQTPFAMFDAGMKAVRFMRRNPGVVSGSLVALLSLRGTGIAGLAQKGWRLLYLYPAAITVGLKYLLSTHRSAVKVDDPGVEH